MTLTLSGDAPETVGVCFSFLSKSMGFEMVGATGFEPATYWSQTSRASQAAPRPVKAIYLGKSAFVRGSYQPNRSAASPQSDGRSGFMHSHDSARPFSTSEPRQRWTRTTARAREAHASHETRGDATTKQVVTPARFPQRPRGLAALGERGSYPFDVSSSVSSVPPGWISARRGVESLLE